MQHASQEHQPAISQPAAQREALPGGGSLSAQLALSPRQTAQRRRLADVRAAPVQRTESLEEEDEASLLATPVQRQENRTGMPDVLKAGIESLSGMDVSDVRVHGNSSQPAQLNALAYAQGNDIHLAPGQEQHLPHEAWHVVQQAQGLVKPTMQMAGGAAVNDDAGLESEADVMEGRAMQMREEGQRARPEPQSPRVITPAVTQMDHVRGQSSTPLGAVQRKIVVNGEKVSRHDLAAAMRPLLSDVAGRHLKPLLEEWQKAPRDYPTEAAADFNRLRTELVIEWTRRQADAIKSQLPKLCADLPENQFNTLVYMSSLQAKFSATPLEQAYTAALASKRISSASLATVFSPGKLPATPMSYAAFAEDWSARNAGVEGLIAELHVAGSIKHEEVMHKANIGMGQEMQTGVVTAAGPEIQDADVSFVNVSGQQVLVEVAATIRRLYDKMGAAGADQRARYERLVQVNPGRVLAYAVPVVPWTAFFVGEGNEVVATRAAGLGIGWGLIIDGHYADPTELNAMHAKLAAALPYVTDFWSALSASHLEYSEVQAMTADNLQKRLKRHVPIVAAPSSSSRKEKGRAKGR